MKRNSKLHVAQMILLGFGLSRVAVGELGAAAIVGTWILIIEVIQRYKEKA